MFEESIVNVIGFDSSLQIDSVTIGCSKETQTNPLTTQNTDVQTHELQHHNVQTIQKNISSFYNEEVIYDGEKLAVFLRNVLPKLEKELEDAICSNDIFGLNKKKNSREVGNELECKQFLGSLKNPANNQPNYIEIQNDNIIRDLTWNSNGVLLAAGFSKDTHDGWCNHEASINVYQINKNEQEKFKFHLIQTFSCVKCIKFHPYIPTILAGGFYNGEVVIWDLSDCNELNFNIENENSELHYDVVNCLMWKEDRNGTKLVSGGKDGKIIFWKITTGNLTLRPEERFVLYSQNSIKVPFAYNNCLEINSMDFWNHNESDFVVAAGNQVVHCSLKSAKCVTDMANFKNPFLMNYKPHEGLATCVKCLLNSDIFASSGIDGRIHIYKSALSAPLYIVNSDDCVINFMWMNETNLISWESLCNIKHYKFNSKLSNIIATKVQKTDENITAVAFNLKKMRQVTIGKKGKILFLNSFEQPE